MIADPADTVASRQLASASLRTFMRLPVAQRSSVILMDVLGCSLREVCEVMDFSLPAVKAALHRGRTQLRELADEPDGLPPPKLSEAERDRLGDYVAHFNARDFDAIRAMIADGVRRPARTTCRQVAAGGASPRAPVNQNYNSCLAPPIRIMVHALCRPALDVKGHRRSCLPQA
jgi:transposase